MTEFEFGITFGITIGIVICWFIVSIVEKSK